MGRIKSSRDASEKKNTEEREDLFCILKKSSSQSFFFFSAGELTDAWLTERDLCVGKDSNESREITLHFVVHPSRVAGVYYL